MSTPRKRLFLLAALCFVAMTGVALANDPIPGAPPDKSLLELFQSTGPVGYMMVLTSMAGTAFVIEHLVNVRREKLAPTPLAQDLQALIEEEQYDEAIELCDQEGGYLSNLVGAALRLRHAGYHEMVNSLEAAATEEQFKLQTKISFLSLIGNIGPLLGLLGTVTGMIQAFDAISREGVGDPRVLSGGIGTALITTAAGLIVAIPSLFAYRYLRGLVDLLVVDMEKEAMKLVRAFDQMERRSGRGARRREAAS